MKSLIDIVQHRFREDTDGDGTDTSMEDTDAPDERDEGRRGSRRKRSGDDARGSNASRRRKHFALGDPHDHVTETNMRYTGSSSFFSQIVTFGTGFILGIAAARWRWRRAIGAAKKLP
jgi:hypothetical protein